MPAGFARQFVGSFPNANNESRSSEEPPPVGTGRPRVIVVISHFVHHDPTIGSSAGPKELNGLAAVREPERELKYWDFRGDTVRAAELFRLALDE